MPRCGYPDSMSKSAAVSMRMQRNNLDRNHTVDFANIAVLFLSNTESCVIFAWSLADSALYRPLNSSPHSIGHPVPWGPCSRVGSNTNLVVPYYMLTN